MWALLSFLDPNLFPSLDAFEAEFGTLTDAAQVERLNAKIRPYLLRRQKNDVETTLVPLEETIVWVEMTRFQKRCYRAIIEVFVFSPIHPFFTICRTPLFPYLTF
tara:strand:- start:266 stop:580 length:315 start_codon:yes stop_codon:yes gene_type:complete